jgi:hypothetical protein
MGIQNSPTFWQVLIVGMQQVPWQGAVSMLWLAT